MEIIRPWDTVIVKLNVSELCDLEVIEQEILTISHFEDKSIRDGCELAPNLLALRDNVITPAALQYIREQFGAADVELDDLSWQSWGMNIPEGEDLESHYHALSSLTSVMYPAASNSRLTLMDPRGNACRGYPKSLRDRKFGNFRIDPKPGDLYIFPSYIAHSVTAVNGEFRLSFVNDYFLDATLD